MKKPKSIQASIYDFPVYYDLIFGSDWVAEFRFLEGVFAKHVSGRVRRILEPACGTGRLLFRLSKAGYLAAGLDLNAAAIDFCNDRLERHGFRRAAWVADMADFQVKKPFDAAFNTINSFRHLASEQLATSHLACMAEAVRPGGVYVLGFHLTPRKGIATDRESWSARRGHLVVNTQMWPRDKNPRKRVERFHIRFDIFRPTSNMRIDDCLVLRSYTARQFDRLVERVPSWTIEEVYDFRYSIDDPIEVDDWSEDVVYILKRK
jgi:SAM-dependent methyltransferase